MAQKRKKAKLQHANTRNPLHKSSNSKSFQEKAHVVMKKILKAYGLAPDTFDSFTRMQKGFLFCMPVEPLRFKVEEGHRVSRRLVNFMAESTHRFMRTHYFGDESIGLTHLEFSLYGLSLACMLEAAKTSEMFQPEQQEMLAGIAETISLKRVHEDLVTVGDHIRRVSMMISKVNFRIYGYNWKIKGSETDNGIVSTVTMSSESPISIYFKHNNKDRIAFRVRAGRVIDMPPHNARIDRWFIFHDEEDPPVYLDIYIQSHALQRAKERMDIFPAHKRNYYVMEPLLYMQEVETSPAGHPMFMCYFKSGDKIINLGYFPFIIQENRLIVLTFLPFIAGDTWAGAYLRGNLGLQIKDLAFLGMDKLSFFLTVDFEQIPVLRDALLVTGIFNLIEYAASDPEMNFVIDQKKTQMVKKFFEHKAIPERDMPEDVE
jgi:hypothetical protein